MEWQTARLVVRPFLLCDVDDALAYLCDPEVMRHVEATFDRSAAESFIRDAGVTEQLVHAVTDRCTGRLIGHLIWHPWTAPGTWEVGWILHRDFWHRGLATELTLAVLDLARSRPDIHTVLAETTEDNQASMAVIERTGFTRRADLDAEDLLVWTIDVGPAAT